MAIRKKKVKIKIISLLLFFLLLLSNQVLAGRCTGSSGCSACSSCNYCKHCNNGGSCGVCGGGSSIGIGKWLFIGFVSYFGFLFLNDKNRNK